MMAAPAAKPAALALVKPPPAVARPPRLSICMTIHERPTPVLDAVFGSLRDQGHDELVIVLDRSPQEIVDHVGGYWKGDKRVRLTQIYGPGGWGSPVPAWNRGFSQVSGDTLFAFSSETVQAPQNVARAREILAEIPNSLVFGRAMCSCGPDGGEVDWRGTAPTNLLVDAEHPRPLGFIWAGPMESVRRVGGMDGAFEAGLWYDDDDFFLRLWRSGLDFVFDDSISGVHLHHDRPVLNTRAGQQKIFRNAGLMKKKHGVLAPWQQTLRVETRIPGRTIWRHQ